MRARLVLVALSFAACGGNTPNVAFDMHVPSSTDFATKCGGGPASGAADDHCGGDMGFTTADPNQCMASGGAMPTYGAAMYGTMGYDDACKYVVSYTVGPICIDKQETFTVVLKSAIDGTPVTGAAPTIEAFLDDPSHPAKSNGTITTELSPGAYRISGVELGGLGRWTVRFHFFPTCTDAPGSPKAYAAFYVDSP